MLKALTLILCCQLLGEIAVLLLHLPLPGPVLGMLLLFAGLSWRGLPAGVAQSADTLLGHLPLLFVPAGVGVMVHWQRLLADWPTLVAALLPGTLAVLLITALTMRAMRWLLGPRAGGGGPGGRTQSAAQASTDGGTDGGAETALGAGARAGHG
ncbi:MAG: CidA/LrgA family protein [Chromatiaceae bacterium]|nr:MAG: CidA/LrgA family protein [Chromatiaceae bacterium]